MKSRMLPALAAAGLLVACSDSNNNAPANPEPPPEVTGYNATVHRTDGGIPHIVAQDWASLGYGTGYAAAQDHLCNLALRVLKLRAQLSEFLGPDGGNLESDFFYQLMEDTGVYDARIDPELDALFTGYSSGFNRYVRDTGINNIADPACAGVDWIPMVTADDVRRAHLLPFWLPNFNSLLLAAQPPDVVAVNKEPKDGIIEPETAQKTGDIPSPRQLSEEEKLQLATYAHATLNPQEKGSNGVAIGADFSSDERPLLYTNPHIPWDDFTFRMWAFHQIMPGVTNMAGANQANRANVGFGTNGDIAWTNTVSPALDFMFYKLDLVPGNPLAYMFDGEERTIEPVEVTVQVLDESGALVDASHAYYQSHIGYMIGGQFPWLSSLAFTIRFAEEGARAMQGGALAYQRATTVRELKEAMNQYQSTPNITTVAADSSGEVMFGDFGPMVNFTDQQLVDCLFAGPVYLGNSSACEWNNDEDAAAPGLLGPGKQPYLFRRDYVTNSNNSYWLSNPEEPVTGAPRVVGDVDTERTMRTRSGLMMMEARVQGLDGLAGNRFDLDSLIDRMLSNQNTAGQLFLEDLLVLCADTPLLELDGSSVDLRDACTVLSNWDRSSNLDSRGAHLFREFMRASLAEGETVGNVPAAFKVKIPFDPKDPVNTPAGLDTTDNPAVLPALAKAVVLLQENGIPLDASLGDIQGVTRTGEYIPLHGGEQFEGVFNKMALAFEGESGYPEVTGSSASWVMATRVAGEETRIKGLTTYSQSSDPTSENYADLTKRFSEKDLVDIPFRLEDVEAAALSTVELIEGSEDCADEGWKDFSYLGITDEASCRDYFSTVYDERLTGFVDD